MLERNEGIMKRYTEERADHWIFEADESQFSSNNLIPESWKRFP